MTINVSSRTLGQSPSILIINLLRNGNVMYVWLSRLHILYRYWDYPQGLFRVSICRYSANKCHSAPTIQSYLTTSASKNRKMKNEKWKMDLLCSLLRCSPSIIDTVPFLEKILSWLTTYLGNSKHISMNWRKLQCLNSESRQTHEHSVDKDEVECSFLPDLSSIFLIFSTDCLLPLSFLRNPSVIRMSQ